MFLFGLLLGITIGIFGTVIFNHFEATKVKDLGDTIAEKADLNK